MIQRCDRHDAGRHDRRERIRFHAPSSTTRCRIPVWRLLRVHSTGLTTCTDENRSNNSSNSTRSSSRAKFALLVTRLRNAKQVDDQMIDDFLDLSKDQKLPMEARNEARLEQHVDLLQAETVVGVEEREDEVDPVVVLDRRIDRIGRDAQAAADVQVDAGLLLGRRRDPDEGQRVGVEAIGRQARVARAGWWRP